MSFGGASIRKVTAERAPPRQTSVEMGNEGALGYLEGLVT